MNLTYIVGNLIVPLVIAALLGLILGWLLFRGKKQEGDLSVEGEKSLRAEADKLRTENQALKGRLSAHETEVSDLKGKLAAAGTGAAAGAAASASADQSGDDDENYALEWRNRYLAARVKYLEGRLSEAPKASAKKAPAKKTKAKATASKKPATKKTAAKKTTTKKTAAKKVAAKKPAAKKPKAKAASATAAKTKSAPATKAKRKPGPKPGTKRGELTASGKPRKKPGPKPGSTRAKSKASKEDAAFEKYYTNVKKYDAKAKRKTVENIVKYCGVALQSRDSSLVACSDEAELKRVADGFVTKKLEQSSGQMELVKDICQEMKSDRFKSRVTFYYLAAKKARKISLFN